MQSMHCSSSLRALGHVLLWGAPDEGAGKCGRGFSVHSTAPSERTGELRASGRQQMPTLSCCSETGGLYLNQPLSPCPVCLPFRLSFCPPKRVGLNSCKHELNM